MPTLIIPKLKLSRKRRVPIFYIEGSPGGLLDREWYPHQIIGLVSNLVEAAGTIKSTCRRSTFNYKETTRFITGTSNAAHVRFRSGLVLDCKSAHRKWLWTILKLADIGVTWSLDRQVQGIEWTANWEKGIVTTPQGISFDIESVEPLIFAETFLYDTHFVGFNLEGKTVVDLGGFVGDSALYYASKGAHVFVLEPNPLNYAFLAKNLELNPRLRDRITAYQQAAGLHARVRFPVTREPWGGGRVLDTSQPRDKDDFVEVDSVRLGDILKEIASPNPFLLKCDCKGCEVELVRDPAISAFSMVKIEYTLNTDGPGTLIAQLRNRGFSNFRIFKHNFGTYNLTKHGTIMASK